MTRGQPRAPRRVPRLAAVLAAFAALLLLGRGTALLYVDRAWYAALGASSVWYARVTNTVMMHATSIVVGTVFAYFNIAAVRASVVSLIVPRRVGNVSVGEEIPSSRLVITSIGMSLFIAIVATLALPSWTVLAHWRSGVRFGESDPYFGADLGYYVTWLPLETSVYVWAMVLFAIVAGVVVTLYSLTPSLSWSGGTVRVTTHARRHLSVLGAILVLFIAWGFRLDAYDSLIGNGNVFGYFQHKWVIPADLTLSIVAIGAAVVLLIAGWMGQTALALISVSTVLGCALASKAILPAIGHYIATRASNAAREAPYRVARQAFTRRAFPPEPISPSMRFAADSTLIATAGRLQIRGGLPPIVYPRASGVAIEADSQHLIRSPRVGGRLARIMNAWAEQDPRLLESDLPRDAAFIRRRDLRDRVNAVAPIFFQSGSLGARPTPDGLMWIVDLYSTSDRYPLSEARPAGNAQLTYRHHVATAYVSGMTGGVTVVPDPDSVLDPVAKAWFSTHRGSYLQATVPRELTELRPLRKLPEPPLLAAPDSAFRTHILNLYSRMRVALDSGDLHAFADAFDSLGAAVGARHDSLATTGQAGAKPVPPPVAVPGSSPTR